MDTGRLYYEDPYLREFDATVVEVRGKELVLDRTAFFPGGGGQETDSGVIGEIPVVAVAKKAGVIVHVAGTGWALRPGDRVHGRIDWPRREALMRAHTGEHLLMGELQRRAGAEIEKVAIREGEGTLFLRGLVTWEQVREAQRAVNDRIRAGLKAHAAEMGPEEARKLPGVRISDRLAGLPRLRILNIGDVDYAACAGVHVHDTSEILALLVTSLNVTGKKGQLGFAVGEKAVARALDETTYLREAAGVTNSAVTDLPTAVRNLGDRVAGLRASLRESLLSAPATQDAGGTELLDLRLDGIDPRDSGEFAARLARQAGEKSRAVVIWSAGPEAVVAVGLCRLPGLAAGEILKAALAAVDAGGGGGGSRELATGSCGDIARLHARLVELVRAGLNKSPR